MSQEFHEHWLSAYLDDELSSDERALVERRLEEDPQARKLLEDLKLVRGLVATLPNWESKEFPFDVNRLAHPDPDDETDVGLTSLRSGQTTASASTTVQATSPSSVRIAFPRQKNFRIPTAASRGLLSLAAGILLLIFCLPLFWKNIGSSRIAQGPPQTGNMLGSRDRSQIATDLSTEKTFGAVPSAMSKPTEMPTPAAPGTADEPQQQEFFANEKVTRGAELGSAPPGPPSRGMPSTAGMAGMGLNDGLPGGLNQPSEPNAVSSNARSESKSKETIGDRTDPPSQKLQMEMGAKAAESQADRLPEAIASNVIYAKSAAWSDAEVSNALPQLRTIAPDTRGLSEARAAGDHADRSGANEWLVMNLPNSSDLSSWFAQIQSTHALTPIPIGPLTLERFSLEKSNSRDKGVPGKVVQPSQPQTKDVGSNGQIVLFVTESEAKQILAKVLGSDTLGYWRVKPMSDDRPDVQVAEAREKVIVFLKQSP